MNTNKERFLGRVKNNSSNTCVRRIDNTADLSLCILSIPVCLVLLVGILS